MKNLQWLVLVPVLVGGLACSRSHSQTSSPRAVELQQNVTTPFRFVAYGDTRFTDPNHTDAANPTVRRLLVQAIADSQPAFISIGGDIVYRGADANDWKVFDSETKSWRDNKIPVYPALGNHDLSGDQKLALGNYFQRFPDLNESRWYSVRVANALLLVLDSSLDEIAGPQGQWLNERLDTLPSDVDFVFLGLHHPPYTSSSDNMPGGGHSPRPHETRLAKVLEARQPNMRARIVVFAGHVHNYERFEHGGVTYFVTGGGAAHPYMVNRAPTDLFQGKEVNYHYLLAEVDRGKLKVTMNRLDITTGKPVWTQPDSVSITVPVLAPAKAAIAK